MKKLCVVCECGLCVLLTISISLLKVLYWKQFGICMEPLSLNVTGLPPFTLVKITLQAGAHYWGPELIVNATATYTDEDGKYLIISPNTKCPSTLLF